MRSVCFAVLAFLSLEGCSIEPPKANDPSAPNATAGDFKIIEGDDWIGTLTYLDYGSNKRSTIPAKASVSISSPTTIKYTISYPEEPWEDTKAKLKISRTGFGLDGHPVTFRKAHPNGSMELRTLHRGKDNRQHAQIRMTYILNRSDFSISKDVKRDEGMDFVNRNKYAFTRP